MTDAIPIAQAEPLIIGEEPQTLTMRVPNNSTEYFPQQIILGGKCIEIAVDHQAISTYNQLGYFIVNIDDYACFVSEDSEPITFDSNNHAVIFKVDLFASPSVGVNGQGQVTLTISPLEVTEF